MSQGWIARIKKRLRGGPVVPVLRLHGAIGAGGRFGGGMNAATMLPLIDRAFTKKAKAVALSINSPGGSPAQSSLIAAHIRAKAEERGIKVYGFVEDVAASGGYWLATAADEIYADRSSIVGSIGVISAGFGFQEFIKKHGIERRVHTAGEDKSMLDPFRPEKPEDIERLKELQRGIHQHFIDQVERRRSGLADGIFTGEFWLAEEARDKGLIDGIGHLRPVMREEFGEDVRLPIVSAKKSLFRRLGAPSASDLMGTLEADALWSRYGL
ncbi:S49 family peptidase [Paracoccaceae bacterium GXU_MW_L88]